MVHKWKTILDDEDNAYQSNLENENIHTHPIIIFYDEFYDKVYYLSLKGYKSKYNDLIKSNKYILINPDTYNPNLKVLHKPSIIDTTTIYCMSKSEFLSTFKVSDNDVENWYQQVDINLQQQVLEQILKNLDDNHIGFKELLSINKFSNNLNINTDTKYGSNSWIKQELINQYHNKNPKLLQTYLNTIDNNDNKVNLFNFTKKSSNLITSLNRLKTLMIHVVNEWIDHNNINVNHKNYIDIDQYSKKWRKETKNIHKS